MSRGRDNRLLVSDRFLAAYRDLHPATSCQSIVLQRPATMRREIVAHVDRGGAGLSEIVRQAIASNRDRLLPAQTR